jgi:hypothetical protein
MYKVLSVVKHNRKFYNASAAFIYPILSRIYMIFVSNNAFSNYFFSLILLIIVLQQLSI